MTGQQPNNPLHGITLEAVLTALVEHYGWAQLGILIKIRCFFNDPSIKSSLKFLRQTPWARSAVEQLYLDLPRDEPAAIEAAAKQAEPAPGEGTEANALDEQHRPVL